jgi:hypothetical protein
MDKKIQNTKLSALGLSPQARKLLVDSYITRHPKAHPDDRQSWATCTRDGRYALRDNLADKILVEDLIQCCHLKSCELRPDCRCGHDRSSRSRYDDAFARLGECLGNLGATRYDWIHIPQQTMTHAKLSKRQWLAAPVGLLGTLPAHFFVEPPASSFRTGRVLRHVRTVADLLRTDPRPILGSNGSSYLRATQAELLRVGFVKADGIFMKISFYGMTKKEAVRYVMERGSATEQEAKRFIEIARKIGPGVRKCADCG